MKQEEKQDPKVGDEISYRSMEGCTVATVEEVNSNFVECDNGVTVPDRCILEVIPHPMNQKIRNALDDLETTADNVEDRFMSDMIMQSVNELREELEE